MTRYRSFAEFWPHYLREHGRPETRGFHYFGTGLVLLLIALALWSGNYWLFLALPIAGYSPAWISHALIEHNRPATFTYPLWSFIADFRMFWCWLTGRLGPELDAAGVSRAR